MNATKRLDIGDVPTQAAVLEALSAGETVVMPSETVYGLFADATDDEAVARIFAAKGRPAFNPLIAHCCDVQMASSHGVFDETAMALAQAFWPGPLTLVLPKKATSTLAELTSAGLASIALRVPEAPFLRHAIATFGRPLAGPSANRSGRLSPTSADAVLEDLAGSTGLVADGGETRIGIESTIVACLDGQTSILRPGSLTADDLETIVGRPVDTFVRIGRPQAPGMLVSHYAPSVPVRLDARSVKRNEALLAFGPHLPDGAEKALEILNLSAQGNLTQAAARLYRSMRVLDRLAPTAIAVMPIPETGLGVAIMDRLRRAAAPR